MTSTEIADVILTAIRCGNWDTPEFWILAVGLPLLSAVVAILAAAGFSLLVAPPDR